MFELIDELHPALVIIDPLRSFLEGNAAANGDVMRRALDMLQEKALADQFSVVIVSHMVKKAGDDARMLLAGSGELWNAARSVTILGRLPMDESVTYVTQEKLNVGTKARSILFHTQTVGVKNKAGAEVKTVRAVLAATTEKHYKELMADKPMPLEPSQRDAKESIMALLKEQGPMAGMDLKKLVMDETGCSKRTVERAHTCLVKEKKIQTKRVRQADGKFKFITSLCAVRAVRRVCGEVGDVEWSGENQKRDMVSPISEKRRNFANGSTGGGALWMA